MINAENKKRLITVIIIELLDDMRTTVKTLWIYMILMLTCSFSIGAVDFTKVYGETTATCEVSASFSSCSDKLDNVFNSQSTLTNTKLIWNDDAELGGKPVTESYIFNSLRLRRSCDDASYFKAILSVLSSHQDLLVYDQTRLYSSNKIPYYTSSSSDYYIYTLRRILI